MSIISLDGYIASAKQKIRMVKTASRTSLALTPFTSFDLNGDPGAGTLAGASTTAGIIQTDALAGFPIINAFGGGATGYLSQLDINNGVVGNITLYDMIWKGGAYLYNSGTTNLSAQPAISGRCPDYPGSGTVFGNGIEIWFEVSTAFATGNAWQLQVTYTNSAGTGTRTTPITQGFTAANFILGRMGQLALQAGDSGVQKIDSVIATNGGTAMTAGAVNILLMRPLFTTRISVANDVKRFNLLDTGMPIIYADSALTWIVTPDSTGTGGPYLNLEIANG